MKFSELQLNANVLEALDAMRFDECTPIQEQAIPIILEGKDLIAVAQTGTGKTAAFLLPVLNKLSEGKHPEDAINCVIMSPTRELAQQIDQQMEGFSYFMPVSSVAVYGGNDGILFEQQKKGLTLGADVVIATPGRLIAHLSLGYVDLSKVSYFILDEADRMLDMGFYDDIMQIVKYLPKERQTIMFSATMPAKIQQLANTILNNPAEVKLAVSRPAEKIVQAAYVCYENQKLGIIRSLFAEQTPERVIIFASSKLKVKEVTKALKMMKLNVGEMHSDLEQAQREEVMHEFKAGRVNILVATDIVARGIDIDDIRCGKVTVSLLTDPRKHTNHREVLHGGVMMALADSVTGVTGASVGAVVVTVSLTMSFIRNARPGSRIRVKSHITHNGRTTIVIAAEMYDEDDKLMANILADMMIVDHFPEIPRKW